MNFISKATIALGLCMALTAPACNDVIDIEPVFVKDGSAIYTTLTDYEFALTGAYGLLRQTAYFGSGGQTTSTWANLPDMMGANLDRTGEDLNNWVNQCNWTYTTSDADIESAWIAAYSVIAQANLVLRNIEKFSAAEPKKVNRLKGQALALRGMAHFDVLRFWGEEYDRASTKLGIPYVTTVDVDNKPSRLTVSATWDAIFKDMLEAETLLGDVDAAVNTASVKAGIDRNAVRGLLARMYLYAKDYVKAEDYATQVISVVPLATQATFPSIWKDASVAEVLFAVTFATPQEGSPSAGVHLASTNRNRFRPAPALEALYDQTADIRFPTYFTSRVLSTTTRRILQKFYGKSNAADNVVNWKVVRTGELYLVRAEARARQGGAKEVLGLADLNVLRAARISGYVPVALSGTPLIDAIFVERRKELVGEGHEWFDLKRTTRQVTRTTPSLTSTILSLAPTKREWVWPIPQGEIDANANIKPQQSPGY